MKEEVKRSEHLTEEEIENLRKWNFIIESFVNITKNMNDEDFDIFLDEVKALNRQKI